MKPETPEQKEKRRARDRARAAKKRLAMTPEEKAVASAVNVMYQRRRRAAMAIEERRQLRRELWKKYHCDAYRRTAAAYMRRKRATDESFAIAERLRARIKTALRRAGVTKHQGTAAVTGCSKEHLSRWIEQQFLPGMTWSNRSEWHVDHIIPCAAFNLADDEQQAVAFHYTNLRPLWKSENQIKSDSVPVPQRKIIWTLSDVRDARRRIGLQHQPRAARA